MELYHFKVLSWSALRTHIRRGFPKSIRVQLLENCKLLCQGYPVYSRCTFDRMKTADLAVQTEHAHEETPFNEYSSFSNTMPSHSSPCKISICIA